MVYGTLVFVAKTMYFILERQTKEVAIFTYLITLSAYMHTCDYSWHCVFL